MSWRNVVMVGVAVGALQSCREDIPLYDDTSDGGSTIPPTTQFEQRLSFFTTGLSTNYRSYTKLSASYNQSTGITTIQTIGDSVAKGKLILQFHGGSPGLYRYSVRGSSNDIQEMDVRFIPTYNGSTPSSTFELTENPLDSLEAQTTVTKFGPVGDSINGFFTAQVKLVEPPMQFKIFLYNGEFRAQRRGD